MPKYGHSSITHMTNPLIKKILSGSFLRAFLLFCNIIISLFMMPFLINSLGQRFYGLWAIVGKMMGYYGFLDFGLSSSVSRFLSRSHGQQDTLEMNKVANTGMFLFSLIGLFTLIITIIFVFICHLFIDDPDDIQTFQIVIFLMGGSMAIEFPMRVYLGVLEARVRFDLTTYIDLFKLFTRTLLIFYFVYNGHGIVAMALVVFAVNISGHIITIILAKREFKELTFSITLIDKSNFGEFFTYSFSTFVIQIANSLKFKASSFIIAGFIGLSAVTIYEVAARLIGYFIQIIDRSLGVLTPVFSQYDGKGNTKDINKLFLESTTLSVIISVFIGATLALYGEAFITRWIGEGYNDSITILQILVVPVTIALTQNTSLSLLKGISKHHFYAISNAIEGVANLVLSLILVQIYGIYGVAIGLLIPMLFMKLFIQPVYVCRVININMRKYFLNSLIIPGFKSFLPIYAYYYLLQDYFVPSFVNLFILILVQTLLFVPLCLIFIFTSGQKQYILDLYNRKFKNTAGINNKPLP